MDNKIWTITEVNSAVRDLIENTMMPLWLHGEVGTLNIYRSGHVYLTLKDQKCQIRAVFFSGAAKAREMDLKIGAQVEVFGNLSVYEVRGEYQFVIRSIRPVGIGDLQRRFEDLKNRLNAEGLFDESRKKRIPGLPKQIGVVSSPDGAAVRDFLQVIDRRFPNINIKIYPAACQGKGAENQLAAGIQFFNRFRNVDVIVVTRGGGSMEDLWPFNEEVLARAIAGSDIPVISAVGHEIDFTISDFVADLRVPTPSAAAELVVGRREEFIDRINNLKRRLGATLELTMLQLARRYETAAKSYVFKEPMHVIREKQQILDDLQKTMEYMIRQQVERSDAKLNQLNTRLVSLVPTHKIREAQQQIRDFQKTMGYLMAKITDQKSAKLDQLHNRLQSVNPFTVIKRGYAILTDSEGKTVKNPQLAPGTPLTALVAEGTLELEVKSGESKNIEGALT